MFQVLKLCNLGALVALFAMAAWFWNDLPDRIPVHFDAVGRPDAYAATWVLTWFFLPALATLFVALFVFVLPAWMLRLARTNSRWLNIPDRELFRSMSEEGRVRVMVRIAVMLPWMSLMIQCLFGYILYGTARVALNHWQAIPPVTLYGMLVVVLASSVACMIHASRSVRREVRLTDL